jgi:mannose-1-phosphate guanylyltransferase/mannose-6-phosphate isomerase
MGSFINHDALRGVPDRKRFAVVLAGGSGTRLWPLSRSSRPKQLLALNGSESLLQQTVRRLLPMVPPQQVLVITQDAYRFEVMGQLYALDPALADNVLAEPMGRNTLPAISWAAAHIAREHPDALVGVFSSDHAIADQAAFLSAWVQAEIAAAAGFICLFGIRPTEPATGYGYIEAGDPLAGGAENGEPVAHHAVRFIEKPVAAKAQALFEQGRHLWNSGMFVFAVDSFLRLLGEHHPTVLAGVQALAGASLTADASTYGDFQNISIDSGLLEHCDRVAVVPVDMGWSDLGSWEAIYRQQEKDADGNVVEGDVIALGSRDNLLWSDHGVLALLGVEGLAIVQTRDATLVCPRNRVEELKSLVAAVSSSHQELTESHLTVVRPWGSYTLLEEGPRYKIKRIVVNPSAKLSMQMHFHRSEHWIVISGTAKITNGEQEIFLEESQSTYIQKTHHHRLENPGNIPLQIIEIQCGTYLSEDDIVRFDDIYGRKLQPKTNS